MVSHTIKEKARRAVMVALYYNEIERPGACSVCRAETKVEAHHEDYDKPLDVIWMCRKCHVALHVKNRGIVKPPKGRTYKTGGGRLKLKSWAKRYGIKQLADDLGVHQSSVYGWISGSMTPSTGHCVAILEKAGRKLKLSDIVDGY